MRLPLVVLHVSAGVLAMFAGAAAISFRKGSPPHARAGNIFVAAMLGMAAAASCLAFMKHQTNNLFGGLLTLYMVSTAWATARRREGEKGVADWVGFVFALTIGVLSVLHGLQKAAGRVPPEGSPAFMDVFMGSVILLAGLGDLRMLLRGISGKRRIARHFGVCVLGGLSRQVHSSWGSNRYSPSGCADRLCSWCRPFCRWCC
jgi:hypothetical protein